VTSTSAIASVMVVVATLRASSNSSACHGRWRALRHASPMIIRPAPI
jgi:hypothetical protein